MRINVTLIKPRNYIHALALIEAAEYVYYSLKRMGLRASFQINKIDAECQNIIFGAHLAPAELMRFSEKIIVFNSEQLPERSAWMSNEYLALLSGTRVLDYSSFNLNCLPHGKSELIDFLYIPELKRIELREPKTVDLVFYGSVNSRRKKIIEKLRNSGLVVETLFGVYGDERDKLIARSKAVLNLHFYDSQIFQQIRCFYPLINRIPVISENYPISSAPDVYEKVVFTPGQFDFVKYTSNLIKDSALFDGLALKKMDEFSLSMLSDAFDKRISNILSMCI